MTANDRDLIGWIGPSRKMPPSEQRERLLAAGVRPDKICELGKDGVLSLNSMFGDGKKKRGLLRAGTIVCVCGLSKLAKSRPDLGEYLDRIAAVHAYARNVLTGRTVDPASASEVAEAYREYAAEGKSLDSDQARKNGAKGGRKKTPLGRDHQKIWKDVVNYEKNEHAADKVSQMLGRLVSVQTLRNTFGVSGRMSGAKRNHV
jgi:hypothetical protein